MSLVMPDPAADPVPRVAACIGELLDPRTGPATRHRLHDLLTIAVGAAICREDTWGGGRGVGHDPRRRTDGLAGSAPRHPVPRHLLPAPAPGSTTAIDGKTARRSGVGRTGQSPLHLVRAHAGEQRLVLGGEAAADHSHELTAIPLLGHRLVVTDQVGIRDPIGCQTGVAAQIVAGGGDVLVLDDTQPTLLEEVMGSVALVDAAAAPGVGTAPTGTTGHRRREHRHCAALGDSDGRWPDPRRGVRITVPRNAADGPAGAGPGAVRYSISRVPPDAIQLNRGIRSHWAVEHGLHWVLAMDSREDASRVRVGYGRQHLALLRNVTHNRGRHNPDRGNLRLSIQRKRAGWSMDIRFSILGLA
jgi:predicted transposase YbfD/YdcC